MPTFTPLLLAFFKQVVFVPPTPDLSGLLHAHVSLLLLLLLLYRSGTGKALVKCADAVS